ncbi:hypothetical protein BUZ72_12575 [Staphylococcus saprophyticus]|uniref:hypothetical protein n=1 Tax=Staphylococcus saprophyticus TaxID=29385 RepID=UPI000D1F9568|nr:hypothetical protein [Staphylococcus saprophyticus]PTK14399.1 hypothetical protein BUZ72_12575 [Staphylococcus saprophyticus]
MRDYINVRLSYETKYFIEYIQFQLQESLQSTISESEIPLIEKNIKSFINHEFKEYDPKTIDAISITTILKISSSSIIEGAFKYSSNFSLDEWKKIEHEMNTFKKIDRNIEVGSLTPKLYLERDVITGLNQYQKNFMKESMVRVVRLSYVIGIVVFAYYKYIFEIES